MNGISKISKLIQFGIFTLFLTGCGGGPPPEQKVEPPPPPPKKKEVFLYINKNRTHKGVLEEFEKKNGISVVESHYSSNEELLAKIKGGASGYDLICPADYMVETLIRLGLLEKWDKKKPEPFSAIYPWLLNRSFDPGNEYSLPYFWSVTGIVINRHQFKGEVTGLQEFFFNRDLEGKTTLLNEIREGIALGLRADGKNPNTQNKEEIESAKQFLIANKSLLKGINSDPIPLLEKEEAWIAQMFSPDGLAFCQKNPGKMEFLIPQEGSSFSIYSLCIPRNPPNLEHALRLAEFLTSEKNNRLLVKEFFTGPVVSGVLEALPKELLNFPLFNPPDRFASVTTTYADVGEASHLYEKGWLEVLSTP